ncbi:response regulator transcription factor [Myroides phaeus]|uniref:Phosphate regulon transcriptional regulatory protein PhoB n=1 Tax=Myroides phaeus TaxID=702745 RepID=A0A1G8FEQ2_9FLAO|nr:response regulator transcription factor [Myroides phaeus]MEC4115351.1 response regulator transcription factor [Myroides phaeus]SDH80570.1 two-component system, OmpR family, alkaline phosphatase synthesis response regulator PhoP [Myroides phaeus]
MKNSKIKILLVDDDPDIIDVINYNLKKEGYKIFIANSGAEALETARKVKPHLILLDVMMPEMDGIETCEGLRKMKGLSNTVIAFLSARGEDYSQVAGYDAGADDYITKPIRPKVLIGKVKGLLRRFTNDDENNGDAVSFGDLVINRVMYKVFLRDEEIRLPKKEFELLSLLSSNPGKVFDRYEILDLIWGVDVVVNDRTIDVHVKKLRSKLGENIIKTIKGVGYKFEMED